MPTIFDFVNATEMVSYWETLTKDRPPYLGPCSPLRRSWVLT